MTTILIVLFIIIFLWLVIHSIDDHIAYKNLAIAIQNKLDDFSIKIEGLENKTREDSDEEDDNFN